MSSLIQSRIPWLEKKERGEHVNEKDLRKHKLDVFRLLQIVPDDDSVELNGLCKEAAVSYINRITDETINLEQIGISFSKEEAVERLRELYSLS